MWSLELMSWPFPGCPCYDVWQGNRYEPELNLVKNIVSQAFHLRCSSDSHCSLRSISVTELVLWYLRETKRAARRSTISTLCVYFLMRYGSHTGGLLWAYIRKCKSVSGQLYKRKLTDHIYCPRVIKINR